jgi:hypothetical protein
MQVAESEQSYPDRGNSNADDDYLQRAAGAVLEVIADRFSHTRSRIRRVEADTTVRAHIDVHTTSKLGAYGPKSRFTSPAPKTCSLKAVQDIDHVYADCCQDQAHTPTMANEEGAQRHTHQTNKRQQIR